MTTPASSSTRTAQTKPRRALSIRATIIAIAGVAFGCIVFAAVALAFRVVPSTERLARRGAAARDDYSARSTLAAQLDSTMSDIWRLLRVAKVTRLPADSIDVRRARLETIARAASRSAPSGVDLGTSLEFGMGLERADAAMLRVTASMLGSIGALESGDLPLADRLMSRADSLDAPFKARLNAVTQVALSDLARQERELERETRFATRLLLGWILVCVLAGPILWRLLQRRLMQPLSTFDTALHRVEAGDLDVELPIAYDDELGRLGAHFNRTTQVLRTQRAEGERAAVQSALEASELRYREAFEKAAVGLAEVGLDGTFLRVNRAIGHLFGLEPSAIIGRSYEEFSPPEDDDARTSTWPRVVDGDASVGRVERRYLRRDGAVRITQVTATLVRDADGAPRHVLAVVNDITDQRRLEREVTQSTKLEAVGQLAGGVAHDFNNLLAGIIGYAELLEENPSLAPAVRDDATSIKRAALKGADLSRSLLALARRNTRRDELFDLDTMVRETADLARRTFDRRVEIELTAQDAPTIRGDRSLLSNALLNLAVNARDAMPDGGALRIRTHLAPLDEAFRTQHALPGDAPIVLISVSDTGEGMSEAVLEHVFEPFFTTKAPDKGTGLGLAMVYGTVKDHRGAITISSAEGEGTTVTMYLPCVTDVVSPLVPRPQPAMARTRFRVLVVDDELLVRNVAKRLLERLGYDVETAVDGVAAIERLDVDDPGIDLVIVDGNMPRLNGIETARRIHARHPALPMLFATGHFEPAEREDLAALGFRDRLEKPFSLDVFAETVARCLEHRSG